MSKMTQLILAWLLASSSMLGRGAELPSLLLTLSPKFDGINKAATAINLTLQISDARSRASRPLLKLDLNHGPTPTQRYDGDALSATDDAGSLPLSYTDTNETDAQRTWVSARDPVGPVIVRAVVVARMTDTNTSSGPRIDLRDDYGGLVGMGAGFIPYPPTEDEWKARFRWDVPASAPPGTRVASSLGDGLDASAVGLPSRIIAKSYFAVGPLQRWPAWDVESITATTMTSSRRPDEDGKQDFAVYWIGTLPYDSERMAATTRRVFLAVSGFFGDRVSPFRVFWRRVWTGYGGAGGYQSFLLEHSAGTPEEQSEDALTFLLSHEMIHEYALMYPGRAYDMWYREGVAQYYAAVAPFLGGGAKADLVRWLNNNAQAYYTSGTIGLTWQQVVDGYWRGVEVVKTPYARGFVYLARVQGLIASATQGQKGLDDVVLELYRMFLAHEKCQTDTFLALLGGLISKDAAEASFADMANGTLIVPPVDGFARLGLKMVRRDAEKLELGFDAGSFSTKKIKGLVKGSRAEQAGIREGDDIVSTWALWGAGDALENMMQVVVRREGKETAIKYLPRSHEKVENWMWVEDAE